MLKKFIILAVVYLLLILAVVVVTAEINNHRSSSSGIRKTGKLSCAQAASSFVGLSEIQAVSKAQSENRTMRIVARDGQSFAVTQDYSPNRLNLEIKNGAVSKATCS